MSKVTESFMACGKAHASEREAVVAMVDRFRVSEAVGGDLFSGWAKVCETPMLRGGLAMVAEREYYHSRVFDRRMDGLGAERTATLDAGGNEGPAYFADPNLSDLTKVKRFNEMIGEPEQLFSELKTLVERIVDDAESQEMLRLLYQDEMSTTLWLRTIEAKLAEEPARVA